MGSHQETEIMHTKSELDPYIMEYPALMDTAQLSAARLSDIEGSIEARSFAAVLEAHDVTTHEEIITTVGARFDDALINFVVAAVIGRRNQEVVIRAEASEGLDGYFPWEEPLLRRIELLATRGLTRHAQLRIERYVEPIALASLAIESVRRDDDSQPAYSEAA